MMYPLKKEFDKDKHVCFKPPKEDEKVKNLTYKQIFKLSVMLSKKNEKL